MAKKYIIFVGLIILSNVYYVSANSEQNNSGGCIKDSYSNMEPSFLLSTRNYKSIINKGDTIKFEVYITGYGHIANITKIYVTLPIGLVDDNTIYGSAYYFGFNNNTRDFKDLTQYNFSLNTPNGFYLYFPNDYFSQINITNCYTILTFTEMKYDSSGKLIIPILINITTSKNAPEGDHNIDLFLTYSDGKKWYQDSKEILIHVNNPVEEKRQVLFIILTIFGLLISIISVSEWAKQKFKEILFGKFGFIISIVVWISICIGIFYILYLVYFSYITE